MPASVVRNDDKLQASIADATNQALEELSLTCIVEAADTTAGEGRLRATSG